MSNAQSLQHILDIEPWREWRAQSLDIETACQELAACERHVDDLVYLARDINNAYANGFSGTALQDAQAAEREARRHL